MMTAPKLQPTGLDMGFPVGQTFAHAIALMQLVKKDKPSLLV